MIGRAGARRVFASFAVVSVIVLIPVRSAIVGWPPPGWIMVACDVGQGDGLVLSAHLAAGNPQCALLDGGTALAVFGGPHAYISPAWYRTQPAVPTWDYAAVHVHGTLEPVDETEAAKLSLVPPP